MSLYKSFCKEIEFKNYLWGVGDPGTRLMLGLRKVKIGEEDPVESEEAPSLQKYDIVRRYTYWVYQSYSSLSV